MMLTQAVGVIRKVSSKLVHYARLFVSPFLPYVYVSACMLPSGEVPLSYFSNFKFHQNN
jgi:hypothetical protein